MVLSYGFVLATALGAARRCKMVTCHPAALQNQHARLVRRVSDVQGQGP
jgi:hypothetical protein